MRKFAGDLGTVELLVLFGKLLFAGAAMAGVCMVANRFLFNDLTATRFVIKVIYLSLTIGVASVVYFVASKLMHVSEAEEALGMITRKLRR